MRLKVITCANIHSPLNRENRLFTYDPLILKTVIHDKWKSVNQALLSFIFSQGNIIHARAGSTATKTIEIKYVRERDIKKRGCKSFFTIFQPSVSGTSVQPSMTASYLSMELLQTA